MTAGKLLATAIVAATVIGAIGFAYAQTDTDDTTPDAFTFIHAQILGQMPVPMHVMGTELATRAAQN